ncbi:MAG: hypothetical protein Q9164_001875 [Protoblastenia rupestris]
MESTAPEGAPEGQFKTMLERDFYPHFRREQGRLQERIKAISHTALGPAEKASILEECQREIQSLASNVKTVISSVPAHDQRIYSVAMKDLTEQLQRARKTYAPKRRFEFKSSIQHDGSSPQNLEPTVDSDGKGEAPTPATVDLREKLNIGGALMKAPLSTQDASSKSALAQHPQHDDIAATETPNLWNQVDDFKWLRAGHSPNWSVLQLDDERAVEDDDWESIAGSSSSKSNLEKVLELARVPFAGKGTASGWNRTC